MKKLGFMGMGAMGQLMVKNLLQAGYEVHVWNRTGARCAEVVSLGAVQHDSPAALAGSVDVLMAMVTDDEASRSAWFHEGQGAINGLQKGAICIECSTLSVDWCNELEEKLVAAQLNFIAAPIVGSRPQAAAGQLIHLLGGDQEIIDSVDHLLPVNAGSLNRVGSAEQAMAMKLAVNALFGIQVAALGELYGFLQQTGLSINESNELFAQLPVTSPAIKGVSALLSNDQYAPLFPVHLVEKDFSYASRAAESFGSRLPTTQAVQSLFHKAKNLGHANENIHAVAKLFLDASA